MKHSELSRISQHITLVEANPSLDNTQTIQPVQYMFCFKYVGMLRMLPHFGDLKLFFPRLWFFGWGCNYH